MNCCTCAPLSVAVIYAAMDRLQNDTRVCPYSLNEARARLARLEERRQRRDDIALRQFENRRNASHAA